MEKKRREVGLGRGLADLLDETELSVGNILKAECHLVKAKPMWEKADKKYREDPHWFVDIQK